MNRVLVTGVNGFLGRAIASHLTACGYHVLGVGRGRVKASLRRVLERFYPWHLPDARFGELLRETRPAMCIHAAGPASVAQSFADPAHDFANGPCLVHEMLQQLRAASPRTRFLHLSSAAVYGNPATLPVREDQPLAPVSPYGMNKRLAERVCQEFSASHNLGTASVRIFSAYGPGLRRQVIWDILRKAATETEVLLQGTGQETRDFIHAEDVARGIETLLRAAPFEGEAYNLARGEEVAIADLACRVLDAACQDSGDRPAGRYSRSRVRFDGVLPAGTPRRWCAEMRTLSDLGFTPRVPLDAGLAGVAAWFRKTEMRAWPRSFALA